MVQLDQFCVVVIFVVVLLNLVEQLIKVNVVDMKVIEVQIVDIDFKLLCIEVKVLVDGIIFVCMVKVGVIVSGVGQLLFILICDEVLELKVDFVEEDVFKVVKGQKVMILFVGFGGKIVGIVLWVDFMVNIMICFGLVEIKIDNLDIVCVGMYVQVDIIVVECMVLLLFIMVVIINSEVMIVCMVKDDIVCIVLVEMGIQDGQYIEISKGLQLGDKVVVKVGVYVCDGDCVKLVELLFFVMN